MKRTEVLMAMLATARGESFQPVQIQKGMFLLDRERKHLFDRHSQYNFQPYDYGPFDASVYRDIESLQEGGLANITSEDGMRWSMYRATAEGIRNGENLLATLEDREARMIKKVSEFVRSLNFRQLVLAIYKGYPDTKANSVYNG